MKFIRRFAGAGFVLTATIAMISAIMRVAGVAWADIVTVLLRTGATTGLSIVIVTIGIWIHHKLND